MQQVKRNEQPYLCVFPETTKNTSSMYMNLGGLEYKYDLVTYRQKSRFSLCTFIFN